MPETNETLECWFLTGSQSLYGDETLRQVAEQSAEIVAMLNDGPEIGVRLVWKPVLIGAERDPPRLHRGERGRQLHRSRRLDAHFLAGQGLDRRARCPRKPLLHLHTQANLSLPWDEIDMDFMNLNQAAHGDREFGYIETAHGLAAKDRSGPRQRPGRPARIGSWSRAAPAGGPPSSSAWSASGTTCAKSPSPRATRSRPSFASAISVNTYGVNDLVAAVDAAPLRTLSTPSWPTTRPATRSCPSSPREERATTRSATPPASRWAAVIPRRGRLHAPSRPTSRTSAACASSRASPSSASWPMAMASGPKATGRAPRSCGS